VNNSPNLSFLFIEALTHVTWSLRIISLHIIQITHQYGPSDHHGNQKNACPHRRLVSFTPLHRDIFRARVRRLPHLRSQSHSKFKRGAKRNRRPRPQLDIIRTRAHHSPAHSPRTIRLDDLVTDIDVCFIFRHAIEWSRQFDGGDEEAPEEEGRCEAVEGTPMRCPSPTKDDKTRN
jgi:hypothetical protein